MTTVTVRKQLHKQIDSLPDDIVQQVADFVLFTMARRKFSSPYVDWSSSQWQDFILGQFFREEDEVEYSLEDAQEVYHRAHLRLGGGGRSREKRVKASIYPG